MSDQVRIRRHVENRRVEPLQDQILTPRLGRVALAQRLVAPLNMPKAFGEVLVLS